MTLRINWPVELHPMLVHFPIALLCFALFLDAVAWLWTSPSARVAALYTLVAGAVGTVLSVLSGLITPEAREREGEALRGSVLPQPFSLHGFFSGRLVEVHKHWGYVLLALVLVWLGVRLAAHLRPRWYGVAMGVGVLALIALVVTSYYGGDLVYGRRGRERGRVTPASQRIGQATNPSQPLKAAELLVGQTLSGVVYQMRRDPAGGRAGSGAPDRPTPGPGMVASLAEPRNLLFGNLRLSASRRGGHQHITAFERLECFELKRRGRKLGGGCVAHSADQVPHVRYFSVGWHVETARLANPVSASAQASARASRPTSRMRVEVRPLPNTSAATTSASAATASHAVTAGRKLIQAAAASMKRIHPCAKTTGSA